MQYDFRSIYSTLLEKWFCLPKTTVEGLFPPNINGQLQDLPLIKNGVCVTAPPPSTSGNTLITNYPNPFTNKTTIEFSTSGGHTLIQIIDTAGRLIVNLLEKDYPAAATGITIPFDASHLPTGVYYARFQNSSVQQVRPMLKVR